MKRPDTISVHAWGKRVGAVAAGNTVRAYFFEYDPKWIKSGVELAPLKMPLGGEIYQFPQLNPDTFKGLPGLLADALPDNFGNALVTSLLAQKGIPKDSINTIDRLSYMGNRGMGALEFKPVLFGRMKKNSDPISDIGSLVDSTRRLLDADFSGESETRDALMEIIKVGTSAGGARAKAVIAWNPTSHNIRSGQFEVPEGYEHWLLKFDGVGKDSELGVSSDYGRIEYAYYKMAVAAGIEMMPCRLLHENGRSHFMTKRFDRDGNRKHHIQSLCAMEHLDFNQIGAHSYEQLFHAIARLGIGEDGKIQAFRRMVFNVVARNCDDHAKNHAFMLKEGSQWQLSPAYDVIYSFNPTGKWTFQHPMSIRGKFDGAQDPLTRDDLIQFGISFAIPGSAELVDKISSVVLDGWAEFAAKANVPKNRIEKIQNNFRRLRPLN